MISRIRGRRDFERLAQTGTRIRSTHLWCTWCPDQHADSTAVGYAIGRAYGPAVDRNRLRRRLRATVVAVDRDRPLPPGTMLIGTNRRTTTELTFDQVGRGVADLVRSVRKVAPCSE